MEGIMRCWQYIGFNEAAKKILAETKTVGDKEITCRYIDDRGITTWKEQIKESAYTKERYAVEQPWYDSENELYRYKFDDGRILEDYVQAEPWSSGPCTFMALRDAVSKEPLTETLWSEEDIQKA
jgi:hypothetical protein